MDVIYYRITFVLSFSVKICLLDAANGYRAFLAGQMSPSDSSPPGSIIL